MVSLGRQLTPLDASGYAARIHAKFDPLAPGAGAGAGDAVRSVYPATDDTNPNYALAAVYTDLDVALYTCNLETAVAPKPTPRAPPKSRSATK